MFDQSYKNRLLVSQSSTWTKSRVYTLHPGDINVIDLHQRMPSSPDIWGMSTKRSHCDRFIPRRSDKKWKFLFPLQEDQESVSEKSLRYSTLLKNELFGTKKDNVQYGRDSRSVVSVHHNPLPLCSSPLTAESQLLLRTAQKTREESYQILEAYEDIAITRPGLSDIYFTDLLDWSYKNMLVLGVKDSIYMFDPVAETIQEFFSLQSEDDKVTSVSFNDSGNYVAAGTNDGLKIVCDVETERLIADIDCHTGRVGCLAWNENILCSGSRDGLILQHDIRTPESAPVRTIAAHQKEVCGLKWSPDYQHLASGGNDKKLHIWSSHSQRPLMTFPKQEAAVKAISWSPHHLCLLASGGGPAGQNIMFWDTVTGQLKRKVNTGSQVCNIIWAKHTHTHEIISTHGEPLNETMVWKYPKLIKVAKLPGHSHRVLHLAMSPDGESIATGAKKTIKFWRLNSTPPVQKKLFGIIR